MGLFDFMNKGKQKQLADATISMQNAKLEEQSIQIKTQQEQIDAIVAKVKSVAKEVKSSKEQIEKLKDEQNKCISTYTRFEPEKISKEDLKIRRLSKQSEYNYIVSLSCGNKDEIVMANFNRGNLKTIQEKFEDLLEFQENLQYGGIEKDAILASFEELREYANNNEIKITQEGTQILTNYQNEPLNISKTILYVGDKNTVENVKIKDNKDILQDMDNYSTDELDNMRKADKIVEEVTALNKQDNIEEILIENKEILRAILVKNPEIRETYKKVHRESIENDIFLNSIKYLQNQERNFNTTNEYNYIKLYSVGRNKEAEEFYINNNLDISKLKVRISKGDKKEDISKKFQINRLFSYKHKQNTFGLTEKEEEIYNSFLDRIEPDENYEISNIKRKEEKAFLASAIDAEKTRLVTKNKEKIEDYNELLKRQGFKGRINYEISEEDDPRER